MKTGLHDHRRAPIRDRVAPHTGPITGSTINQQPSTIRGEAHPVWASLGVGRLPGVVTLAGGVRVSALWGRRAADGR